MWGKKHKYKAVKIERDGHWFHSKLEAAVYGLLKLRLMAKDITEIKCQDHVKFHTYDHGKVHMIPDFRLTLPDGSFKWVEAKGYENPTWIRKKKAWKINGPGPLEIWKGSYKYPKYIETIIPKGEGNGV